VQLADQSCKPVYNVAPCIVPPVAPALCPPLLNAKEKKLS
jgi:hypothetical protein